MKAKDLLTICVCVRNGEEHLHRCLTALIEGTRHNPVQIAVLNHSSVDKSPFILETWRERIPWLSVHEFTKEGLSNVRNAAWQLAQTPWISFIDVDCKVLNGWLDTVLDFISGPHADKIGAIGGQNKIPANGNRFYSCTNLLLPTFVGGHHSTLNRLWDTKKRVSHLPTLNIVYNRGALRDVGGFDPVFFFALEDVDLSFRLTRRGYHLWYLPEMQVEHYVRNSLRPWLKNIFLYGQGRWFFMLRHSIGSSPLFLIPFLMALAYLLGAILVPSGILQWKALTVLAMIHLCVITAGLFPRAIQLGSHTALLVSSVLVTWLTHLAFGFGMVYQALFAGKIR